MSEPKAIIPAGLLVPGKRVSIRVRGKVEPAYEVVYFRRGPNAAEDRLRVPVGTATQHVRQEIITRVEPLRLTQN